MKRHTKIVFGVAVLVFASAWMGGVGAPRAASVGRVVAVGDGWLAGVGAGGPLDRARAHGAPALVARRLGLGREAQNLAVPGESTASIFDGVTGAGLARALAAGDRLRARDVLKPLVLDAAGAPGAVSQLDRARALDPDLLLVWIGNVDALRLVSVRGEEPAPLEADEIGARVRQLLTTLADTGARMAVANLPDPTRLPLFRAAGGAVELCRAADGGVSPVAPDALVSLALDPTLLPVPPCTAVVTPADRARVHDTIVAYNAAIAAAVETVARERGVAIATVDAFGLVETLATSGLDVDGDGTADVTAVYGGGFFGRDGLHPGRAGSAVVANAFIDALNAQLGTAAPRVNAVRMVARARRSVPPVGALAADDPVLPQRLLSRLARKVARSAPAEDAFDEGAFTPAVVGTPSSYLMFSGLETGDIREADSNQNCAVVQTPTCSGIRACQMGVGTQPAMLLSRPVNIPEAYVRAYHMINVSALPSPTEACTPINGFDTNSIIAVCAADVCVQTNGQVRYRMRDRINGVTVGSPSGLMASGVWHRVEMRSRLRSGINDDECEFRLDGAVVAASATLNLGTGTLSSAFLSNRQGAYTQPSTPGNWVATFDDLAVTQGVWPGTGRVIARQGRALAPTYNDFSLTGGTAIDAVWSDTPANPATRAQSPALATTAAQTMRVAQFDAGVTPIAAGATPAVCQTWIHANTASNPDRTYAIRRRINGANTDVTIPQLDTFALHYSDGLIGGFWSTTLANMNGAEIGAVKSGSIGGAALQVNDAWLSCEYEPPVGEAACAQPALPTQPVQCVPSWGTVANGAVADFANFADGVSCTTGPAASYTVQSCSIALGAAAGSNIRCAIYDNAPDPNKDALCASASVAAVSNSVNTLALSGCPTLSPNSTYWIVWNTNSSGTQYRVADGGCSGPSGSSMFAAATYPTGAWAPDPWGARQPDTCRITAFMTLLPASGSTTTSTTSSSTTSTSSTSSSSSSTSSSTSTTTSSTTATTIPSTTSTSSTSTTVPTTSTSTSTSSTSTSSTSTSTSSSTTSTIAGLVAAYAFSEGMGDSVADLSGRGNVGTIAGPAWTTSGRFGNALVFDGVNDWVTVADAASLDLTTAITIEAYVFPTVTPADWRTLVAKEDPGGLVYFLHASDNANRPDFGLTIAGTERLLPGTATLAVNAWTHVASTYDGTTQRLYVNGTQVASRAQTGTIGVSAGALRIGGNNLYGEFFQGRIDEIRIYNRALSAAEITADSNRAVP